ncbi:tyramine oxidase subunit B [Gordonia jinhuaensis]|uniref:Ornithine cyclodeaminase n=1 Tax=Gordonia jinhuaensis TaxID=1517702 RepID=A0A916SVR0_9ACTN|nr:tyramine oxidase subunit B [Gordonia jinhuaensis]GGB19940.1 ornithine cyclodeaminase [Gordonia jinhuaensis]
MTDTPTTRPSTAIDFLYLSEPDMIAAGVTDMAACVDTMQETLVLLHRGDYRMAGSNNDSHGAMIGFPETSPFPGMPVNTPDRRFMAMPAYLGGSFGTTGVKWYGSNIDNRDKGLPRSILMFMLNDTVTGAPLALMSANLLSAYRTGAIPGVGARLLARPDSRVVGIVGPGVMAKTSLSAFIAVCPKIDTIKVKGRSRKSMDSFTAWVTEKFPQITTITEVDEIEDAVRDCDIVTFCTTGLEGDPNTYPTVKREWVKPGAFLSMPSTCNIDKAMEAPDVRKVVDNTRMYEAWAEETAYPSHNHVPIIGSKFIDMIHDGTMSKDDLIDIGAVADGDAVGRRSDDEIVIFSVGGMPVEDVAWGTTLYRNAIERGIGTKLNLWETPELA